MWFSLISKHGQLLSVFSLQNNGNEIYISCDWFGYVCLCVIDSTLFHRAVECCFGTSHMLPLLRRHWLPKLCSSVPQYLFDFNVFVLLMMRILLIIMQNNESKSNIVTLTCCRVWFVTSTTRLYTRMLRLWFLRFFLKLGTEIYFPFLFSMTESICFMVRVFWMQSLSLEKQTTLPKTIASPESLALANMVLLQPGEGLLNLSVVHVSLTVAGPTTVASNIVYEIIKANFISKKPNHTS